MGKQQEKFGYLLNRWRIESTKSCGSSSGTTLGTPGITTTTGTTGCMSSSSSTKNNDTNDTTTFSDKINVLKTNCSRPSYTPSISPSTPSTSCSTISTGKTNSST